MSRDAFLWLVHKVNCHNIIERSFDLADHASVIQTVLKDSSIWKNWGQNEVLYPQQTKNTSQTLSSFPAIVKSLVKQLSPRDYPVLNFETWLNS